MLSNESTPNTATIDVYRATLTEIHTRNLASRLVGYEHNPDPREAPNPNAGIRIRRVTPFVVHVDRACQDHNSRVSGIGSPELFQHLWGQHDR